MLTFKQMHKQETKVVHYFSYIYIHIYILKILFSLSWLESVPLFHEHRKQVEKLPAANNPVEK